jgi:hypothetical protein
MALNRRREASTFSLSFLDVIACATGIAIFLTILMLIVTERSVPKELKERYDQARSESAAQERILKESKETEQQARELQEAQSQIQTLTRQRDAMQDELALYHQRTALIADIRALEINLGRAAATSNLDTLLQRRSPFLRETTKRENVWLFFHKPGYVRVIERSGGVISTQHYELESIGKLFGSDMYIATGDGMTVSELIQTGGISERKFRTFDRDREYIGCYVAPIQGCHDDFVRVREVLYQARIEVGFRFELSHDRVTFGYSGRQAPVQ